MLRARDICLAALFDASVELTKGVDPSRNSVHSLYAWLLAEAHYESKALGIPQGFPTTYDVLESPEASFDALVQNRVVGTGKVVGDGVGAIQFTGLSKRKVVESILYRRAFPDECKGVLSRPVQTLGNRLLCPPLYTLSQHVPDSSIRTFLKTVEGQRPIPGYQNAGWSDSEAVILPYPIMSENDMVRYQTAAVVTYLSERYFMRHILCGDNMDMSRQLMGYGSYPGDNDPTSPRSRSYMKRSVLYEKLLRLQSA